MSYICDFDPIGRELNHLKEAVKKLVSKIESLNDLHAVSLVKDSKEFLDLKARIGWGVEFVDFVKPCATLEITETEDHSA